MGNQTSFSNKRGLSILDLPDEILDHIFSFLTIKERIRTEWVCRSWAEFGKNYKWSWPLKLTHKMIVPVILEPYGIKRNATLNDTDELWLSVMSRCGVSLKKLEMTVTFRKGYTSTKLFDIIGSNCRNLTEIMLDLCNKPDDENSEWSFVNVTRGCPKLEKISLRKGYTCIIERSHHDMVSQKLHKYDGLHIALKECRQLKYLELDCRIFTVDECLDAVKVGLKGLYLCSHLWSSNFPAIAETLLSRVDPIEELACGIVPVKCHELQVKVIRHYEKTLKVLNLERCNMRSSKLCEMLITLKNLEVLSIKRSYAVDDQVMNVLASNCTKLWALNINCAERVSDLGISALAALPNLTCLDVSGVTNITGEGLWKLVSQGRLEMFYFAGTSGPLVYFPMPRLEKESNLVQKSCVELVRRNPNLRLVDLRFNDVITDVEELVEELRYSLRHGLIKGPVVLYLGDNQVKNKIADCDKLKLVFYSRKGMTFGMVLGVYVLTCMQQDVMPASELMEMRVSAWGGWGQAWRNSWGFYE